MNCPKCKGLVMGTYHAQGDEVFKCLECKIKFMIFGEEEMVGIPDKCLGCKWLKDDICWHEDEEYSDFMIEHEFKHPDCYEVY